LPSEKGFSEKEKRRDKSATGKEHDGHSNSRIVKCSITDGFFRND